MRNFFLFLLLLHHGAFAAIKTGRHFKRMNYKGAQWPHYIYRSVNIPVDSKVECGSYCQAEESQCDGFAVIAKECHLGQLDRWSNAIGSKPDVNMYISIDKLMEKMEEDYVLVENVEGSEWTKRIYDTRELDVRATQIDCAHECKNIESQCEMMAFESGVCFFGRFSFLDGKVQSEIEFSNVYGMPAPMRNSINGYMQWTNGMQGEFWPKFIFKELEEDSVEACGAQCLFNEVPGPCHYYVYVAPKCYLGNFDVPANFTQDIGEQTAQNVHVYDDHLDQYLSENYEVEHGNEYRFYIYQHYGGINSDAQCSSSCYFHEPEKCHFYVWVNPNCYLGNFDTKTPIGSPSDNRDARIHKEVPFTWEEELFVHVNMSGSEWNIFMFETLQNIETESMCGAHCLLDNSCNVYKWIGTTCYMGRIEHGGGHLGTQQDETVMIKRTNLKSRVDSFSMIKRSSNGEDWSRYIYKNFSSPRLEECQGQCYYDKDTCHYFVHAGEQCFMGNFQLTEDSVIEERSDFQDTVMIRGSDMTSYRDTEYRTINGVKYKDYIYNVVSDPAVQYTEHCSGICELEPACDFFMHVNPYCYLGDFATDYPIGSRTDSRTTYLHKKRAPNNTASDEYVKIKVSGKAWPPKMKWIYDGESVNECASLCSLYGIIENPCELYVYDEAAKKCYLGKFEADQTTVPVQSGSREVGIRPEWITRASEGIYTCASESGWAKYSYREVTLTSDTNANTECKGNCYMDPRPCDLYVQDGTKCYLGDTSITTDQGVVADSTKTVCKIGAMNVKAAVLWGGHQNDGSDRPNDVGVMMSGDRRCDDHGIPDLTNRYASGMTYAEGSNKVFVCGGRDKGTADNDVVRTCRKIDLTSLSRSWQSAASMPIVRFHYPLVSYGRYLYALGGHMGSGDPGCSARVDRYDVQTNKWTEMAEMPIINHRHCAVATDNKIYSMGGHNCNIDLYEVEVYDINSNSWSRHSGMAYGRRLDPACGILKNRANGHKWMVVAGGRYDRREWRELVEYYDLTAGNGWHTRTGLPMRGHWPMGMVGLTDYEVYMFGGWNDRYGRSTRNVLKWNDEYNRFNDIGGSVTTKRARMWAGFAAVPSSLLPSCKKIGADWKLMVRQDSTHGFFGKNNWASDTGNPNSHVYSVMNELGSYKTCDGKYHFKLIWPEKGYYNEWIQSSDPTTAGAVQGYKPISIKASTLFCGLRYNNDEALMDGACDGSWWYAVGAFREHGSGTLPGPLNYVVKKTYLYVKIYDDC